MFSKNAVVLNLNNIARIFRILRLQMLQNSEFYESLRLETLFVLDYLDSNNLASLVVQTFQSLSKAAFSQEI